MSRESSASELPQILPGSGINVNTIEELVRSLWPIGGKEFHMSGGSYTEGEMREVGKKDGMGMGEDGKAWKIWRTDANAVKEVKRVIEAVIETIQEQN
ncbi:hypothetical protein FRC02_003311 [Tulasnella sp. 418]|nr:hypothetical protein FRC02_003311 [Tulasnella sp. 418]